jgi:hypothetical protein
MSKEHAANIRANLKKNFPGFKFSVTIHHHSSINVSLMASPLDFSKDINKSGYYYIQLNHFYLDRYEHSDILKKIYEIIDEGNFDKSEPMTDYFHVGFYVHFNIGQFGKPYTQIK